MTMMQLITANYYGDFIDEIAEIHRLRHRVFKERLGWDVQVSSNMEIDEFDALHPAWTRIRCDDYWRWLRNSLIVTYFESRPHCMSAAIRNCRRRVVEHGSQLRIEKYGASEPNLSGRCAAPPICRGSRGSRELSTGC